MSVSFYQNEQIKCEYRKHGIVPILSSKILGSFAKIEGTNPKCVDTGVFLNLFIFYSFPITDYTCLRRSQLFKMNAK